MVFGEEVPKFILPQIERILTENKTKNQCKSVKSVAKGLKYRFTKQLSPTLRARRDHPDPAIAA
jgi:hypothetical protein